jgi:hypothetical protein
MLVSECVIHVGQYLRERLWDNEGYYMQEVSLKAD